jgi:hypothetical protein
LAKLAWIRNKKCFGMKTMEDEFPSDNKVRALLVGERGLIRRGLFTKVGDLTYQLAAAGIEEAKRLSNGGRTRKKLKAPRFPPTLADRLLDLIDSPVVREFKVSQACKTEPRLKANDVDLWQYEATTKFNHREQAKTLIEIATGCLVYSSFTLECGRSVSLLDIEIVRACLAWTEGKDRSWNRNKKKIAQPV